MCCPQSDASLSPCLRKQAELAPTSTKAEQLPLEDG
ncbi:hypothetical protein Save01_07572 [Streptomyces avermitilis]